MVLDENRIAMTQMTLELVSLFDSPERQIGTELSRFANATKTF
jgi:hypothetical protein